MRTVVDKSVVDIVGRRRVGDPDCKVATIEIGDNERRERCSAIQGMSHPDDVAGLDAGTVGEVANPRGSCDAAECGGASHLEVDVAANAAIGVSGMKRIAIADLRKRSCSIGRHVETATVGQRDRATGIANHEGAAVADLDLRRVSRG